MRPSPMLMAVMQSMGYSCWQYADGTPVKKRNRKRQMPVRIMVTPMFEVILVFIIIASGVKSK